MYHPYSYLLPFLLNPPFKVEIKRSSILIPYIEGLIDML